MRGHAVLTIALVFLLAGCEFFDWQPDEPFAGDTISGDTVAGNCASGFGTAAAGRFEVALDGQPVGPWTASVQPIGTSQLNIFACILVSGGESARIGSLWSFDGPVIDEPIRVRVSSTQVPGVSGLFNDIVQEQVYSFQRGVIDVARFEPASGFRAMGNIETEGGLLQLALDIEW